MRFSELDGARIGVWGAGREIGSLARQLERHLPGARIVAAAFDAPPGEDSIAALGATGVRVLDAAGALAGLSDCDVVVRSPGVSIHRPELRALRESGVTVTTATSLWLAEHGAAGVIGVTGTKGKSTTAALTAELARAAGLDVRLAGNIGVPALDLLDEAPELVVLELSSYQIADLASGTEVAVVTNLFREHTDWHGSEAAYAAEKLRLLTLPGVRVAVLGARCEPLRGVATHAERVLEFGVPQGWDASPAGVSFAGELVIETERLTLAGAHNALNVCAALSALEAIDVRGEDPGAALAGFQALAHRLQPVCECDGVSWVDDSISTTPESAMAALASFPGRAVVLIAGGQDRGQEHGELARALASSGARVIGVPSTGERLIADARAAGLSEAQALMASDLAEAVALARTLAREGTVVLLSPAAPSYDHYRDFEQRGELFAALAAAPPPA